jgi:alkanesulfonate monooxygenase SsuD/methylene tetrahydromethanopterin reductase-like flavin-dependent oxidoreductase (luciferase family)
VRYAVMALPDRGGRQWVEQVRTWEGEGWYAVLTPDTLWTPSPLPALAAAAAVTTTLRIRTWVLAAPLRSAAEVAREVGAVQVVSDGRFELGIGTGRPDFAGRADKLGLQWRARDAAARLTHLEDVVRTVRERVTPRPPVVVTVAGPRVTEVAARLVTGPDAGPEDRIGLALPPDTPAAELERRVDAVRAAAPAVPLTLQLVAMGAEVPAWLAGGAGSLEGAATALPGDPGAAADVLRRWEADLGVDEVVVPVELVPAFGAVLSRVRA